MELYVILTKFKQIISIILLLTFFFILLLFNKNLSLILETFQYYLNSFITQTFLKYKNLNNAKKQLKNIENT